jgi:hypothetical protein
MSLTFTKVHLCLDEASQQLAGGSRHPIIELQHHHHCSCCCLLQSSPAQIDTHVQRSADFLLKPIGPRNSAEPAVRYEPGLNCLTLPCHKSSLTSSPNPASVAKPCLTRQKTYFCPVSNP